MICYVTLGTNDTQRASEFYDRVMAVLGLTPTPCHDEGGVLTETMYFTDETRTSLVLAVTRPFNGLPATQGNGTMISLKADSPAMVDAIHAAALAGGGTCEGAPGPRDEYAPGMYAGYFRDLDGNKLSACFLPVQTSSN